MRCKNIFLVLLIFVVGSFGYAQEKWWHKATFYQIFPISFYDSDGDGYGDFNGIIQKIDYLQYLGIDAIYLNPIFKATSYHGYDVIDYYDVNPKLAPNIEGFKNLVKALHSKGIRVILDLVINHTSHKHPWFIESAKNAKSPYADWYIWSETEPTGWINPTGGKQKPWNNYVADKTADRYGWFYYAAYNLTIPDLNLKNEAVKSEIVKIMKYWLDLGADGFRLDAVRYFIETGPGEGQVDTPATKEFLKWLSKQAKAINPEAYIIGEIYAGWEITRTYYAGEEGIDGAFNFFIGGTGTISSAMGSSRFYSLVDDLNKIITDKSVDYRFYSIFLSNHDMSRFATRIKNRDKQKLSAVLQFTLPGGPPYIYYGDEIGMQDGKALIGDAEKRSPMLWNDQNYGGFTTSDKVWCWKMTEEYTTNNVELQKSDPQSLLNLYRKLISLRKKYAVLRSGTVRYIYNREDKELQPLLILIREEGNQKAIIVANASKNPISVDISLNENLKGYKVLESLWSEDITKPAPSNVIDAIMKEGKVRGDIPGAGYLVLIVGKE